MAIVTTLTALLFGIMPIRVMPIEVDDQPGDPIRGWIASVDLDHPWVDVRVVGGGDDPDGAGIWHARLANVRAIAEREGALLAINGDFFSAAPQTVLGRTIKYAPNAPARSVGWGMTDGIVTDPPIERHRGHDTIWFGPDGKTLIEKSMAPPAWATQGVSGIHILIDQGRIRVKPGGDAHPRTAIGVTKDGWLLMLVIDGRRPGWSRGSTLHELAEIMLGHGAEAALNLDGGGSATMWHNGKVLNLPINGGLDVLRPVANVVLLQNIKAARRQKTPDCIE